jgi:glycerophosphoryl diester phosphodiesterase
MAKYRQTERAVSGDGSEPSSSSSSSSSSVQCHPYPLTVPSTSALIDRHAPQIVIAHRGASAHLPEHSLPGYRLALELGADYIEPDLVATKDHQLIAIHSLDLSVTTNVAHVFGPERMSQSKYQKNQTGYWVYDFTLKEIRTLRLKQRLPDARSTVFDGLFSVPTLKEILELVAEWNTNIQPQFFSLNATTTTTTTTITSSNSGGGSSSTNSRREVYYPPSPRGIYAELKDFLWLMEDANINLLDLLFRDMQKNSDLWYKASFQHMCNTKVLLEHEYRLPPFILQSFEPEVLQNFTLQWKALAAAEGNDDTISDEDAIFTLPVVASDDEDGTVRIPFPTPPTILLVSHDDCLSEEFWFDIDEKYREYISGIGPDKKCFFPQQADQDIYNVMEEATKLGWVVHPWTERPEVEYFVPTGKTHGETVPPPMFPTLLDEILYFKCKLGVHGIFSESVDIAVRAMNQPCPDTSSSTPEGSTEGNNGMAPVTSPTSCSTPESSSSNNNNNKTDPLMNSTNVPLGPLFLFAFILGIFATLVGWTCWNRFSNTRRPRRRRRRGGAGPDPDHGEDGVDDVESTSVGGVSTPRSMQRGKKKHLALPTSEEDDDDFDDGNGQGSGLRLNDNDHQML